MRREVASGDLRWISVADPTPEDLAFLKEELGFHAVDVDECTKPSGFPKVVVHPAYLSLVVHVPSFDNIGRVTVSLEVDVFVRHDVLVTSHVRPIPALTAFYERVASEEVLRERVLERGPAYLLYSVLGALFDATPAMLTHIVENLRSAEKSIFAGNERQMVSELSAIHRDLAGFRSIIRQQRHVYDPGVLHGEWDTPTFRAVFRSLDAKLSRLWEHLEDLWERAEVLARANEQLLDFKLGEFVKILTVIGAVFIPFGLIAQVIVGLDARVSTTHRMVFWSIIALMFIVDYIVLWKARRRRII